jgi:hypothetical protein
MDEHFEQQAQAGEKKRAIWQTAVASHPVGKVARGFAQGAL